MIKAAVFSGWMGFKEHSRSKYGRGFAESLSEKCIIPLNGKNYWFDF